MTAQRVPETGSSDHDWTEAGRLERAEKAVTTPASNTPAEPPLLPALPLELPLEEPEDPLLPLDEPPLETLLLELPPEVVPLLLVSRARLVELLWECDELPPSGPLGELPQARASAVAPRAAIR